MKYDFCEVERDNLPLYITLEHSLKALEISTLDGQIKHDYSADSFFVANEALYFVQSETDRIVEKYRFQIHETDLDWSGGCWQRVG